MLRHDTDARSPAGRRRPPTGRRGAGWLLAAMCLLGTGCRLIGEIGEEVIGDEPEPLAVSADPVHTREVSWRGWSAIEQGNGLITMRHVPAAGGRTLSLEINGDDALLVMPDERGKTYEADSRDNSVHFGGHYTAIGPERLWNVHEQPFNPHAGPYKADIERHGPERQAVRLASRPGTWRGATIAIERTITMYRGTTHVVIDETVTNRGSEPLDFYIWDFTQIDAIDHAKSDRALRRLSFYLPVPTRADRKQYRSFLPSDPMMESQFDETLPAPVLAVHYGARQFKIASHASQWWLAAVDRDSGWTYVKRFESTRGGTYVDDNGPIELYGANRDDPSPGSFVEMELLTPYRRWPPRDGPTQREHWYATLCKGPVLELKPAGVVCSPMKMSGDRNHYDLTGRFGVFYLGSARLRIVDRADKTLLADQPILISPRREFILGRTLPVTKDAYAIVLDVFDHQARLVGELGRVRCRW